MNWSLEGDGVGEPFLFARQTQGSRQGLTGTDAHVPKLVRWRRRAVYTLPARRRQNISRILAAVPLSMTRLDRRLRIQRETPPGTKYLLPNTAI